MLDLKELAEELDDLRGAQYNAETRCMHCDHLIAVDPRGYPFWGHVHVDDDGDRLVDLDTSHAAERYAPDDAYDVDRLKALESLESELGDLHLADRDKGAFVSDAEWVGYCEGLAEDLGYVGKGNPMSAYIDWYRWASAVNMDYSSVDFDGETYWYRD